MKKVNLLVFVVLSALCGRLGVFGQAPTEPSASEPPVPQPPVRVTGYLAGREPDFLDILPAYPEFNSMQDGADVATL